MSYCFRGDAPPCARADCSWILFPIDAIYLLTRYIASSPQGVCWSKTQDALEGKHETVDPSSPRALMRARVAELRIDIHLTENFVVFNRKFSK